MLEKPKNQPLKIDCFHCQNLITVKYVRSSGDYSQKNNWGYWTENEEYKNFYICDDCLVKLYKQHKLEFRRIIMNKKKQNLLRQYILDGTINGKAEMVFITNKHNKDYQPPEKSHISSNKKKKNS